MPLKSLLGFCEGLSAQPLDSFSKRFVFSLVKSWLSFSVYWWFSNETISKSANEILEIKRISNEFKFFNCKMCPALRRWERFARFPRGEERGQTDVFAGYVDRVF